MGKLLKEGTQGFTSTANTAPVDGAVSLTSSTPSQVTHHATLTRT